MEIHRACQPARGTDNTLVRALARAHCWGLLENGTYRSAGEIAEAEGLRGPIAPSEPQTEILVHDIRRLDGALAGVEILACYSKHGIFSHTAKVAKVLVGSAGTPLHRKIPMTFGPARTPDMK